MSRPWLAPVRCYGRAVPNLTLKDVPPALHARLRARAERHRRSLSREAIACLEAGVPAEPVDVDALLSQARAARRRVHRTVPGGTIRRQVNTGRS